MDTNKNELDEQYWKDFGHWHIKMDFLVKEIEKLKSEGTLMSLVSAFLLETQYIEFHLQGFITELDIARGTDPELMQFSGKLRKQEVWEMTLGQLKDEIGKYNAKFLENLKGDLADLNKLRREFAHHIFTYATSMDDLLRKVKIGLEVNAKVIVSLEAAFGFLEENTTFGKILKGKK